MLIKGKIGNLLLKFSIIAIFISLQSFANSDKEMLAFADSLEKGVAYTGKFIHPLSGDTLNRTLKGIKNGICTYTEEMPGGGQMICHYKISDVKEIAKYYRQIATCDSISTNSKITSGNTADEKPILLVKSEYKVNGKKVDNPIAECLQNGTCIIEGYSQVDTVETAPGVTIETIPTGK